VVTALITIAALVTAVLVGWFLLYTTKTVVNQPVLEVTDAYYVGGYLFLTIRNLGGVNATITSIKIICARAGDVTGTFNPNLNPGSVTVGAGTTVVVEMTPQTGKQLYDGDSCTARLKVRNEASNAYQDLTLSFRVVVP